ncbi:MAG TPA: hypothetical protein GXX36_07755 [Clostridiaceae bacterium]|nr:hypothetical protein [Clostridiaceae bacterium]
MRKIITIFVIAVIVFIIPMAAFCENIKESKEPEIRFSLGNAALSLGDEFSFLRNEDSSIEIYHKSGLLSAVVSYDRMDSETLELLRKYYNDYSSDDNYMFSKFIEFRMSFFNSMEELFRSKFLYPDGNQLEESNMKIFGKYTESTLTKSSYSILYNTIYSDKTVSLENTHINIDIPITSEKTVYSIYFTCQKGALDEFVIEEMISLINSLKIPGSYKQVKTLNVFSDVRSISLANQGIYPDLDPENITYDTFSNQNGGYSIKYPSTFIQYRINNITDVLNYVSFKINYNHTVSITAEKLLQPFSFENIINSLKISKGGNLTIRKEGTLSIGNDSKSFKYINYEINSPEGIIYAQDYFIINDSCLYNIKLESRFEQPSGVIEEVLLNMLKSLKFTNNSIKYSADVSYTPSEFTYKDDGFTVLYPKDWKTVKNTSADFKYNTFIMQPPGNFSALEVLMTESELAEAVLLSDAIDLCANENPLNIKYLSTGYKAPYIDKTFTSLYTSSYKLGDTLYIKRLVNYLDDAGRNRMCYSMDIIRGRNIYSLFISSPDYIYSADGKQLNENATSAASLISNSFRLMNAPKYEKAQNSETDKKSEILNQCIIYLKDTLGTDVKGYFPHYDMIEPVGMEKNEYYVTVYAEFYNTSGYFVLRVNTADDSVTIVNYTPIDSKLNDGV